ncbi:MAG: outer membrane beta-barrel protein [Marinifilaceae bacterium]
MSKDIFKDNINKKFDNLEIEPPSELWLNIEKSIYNYKRKKIIIYTIISGMAASVLLAITFNYTLLQEERIIDYQIKYSSLINKSKPVIRKHLYAELAPILYINAKRRIERKKITPFKGLKNIYKPIKSNIYTSYTIPITNYEYRNKYIIDYSEDNNKNKLQVGIKMASSNKSYTNGAALNTNLAMANLKSDYSIIEQEIPKSEVNLHTNINLSIEYALGEKLSLSSGIGYLGFSNKRNTGFAYSELNQLFNDENFIKKYNNADISEINQNFSFIEIPLLIKYTLINKKISLFATAGIGIDFLIKNKSEIIFENKNKISTQAKDIMRVPTCSIIGIGLSTPVYKSIYINAEAQYRYYIKNISNNEAISIKQNMPNISIGLSFKI